MLSLVLQRNGFQPIGKSVPIKILKRFRVTDACRDQLLSESDDPKWRVADFTQAVFVLVSAGEEGRMSSIFAKSYCKTQNIVLVPEHEVQHIGEKIGIQESQLGDIEIGHVQANFSHDTSFQLPAVATEHIELEKFCADCFNSTVLGLLHNR